ncbi:MAG: hypothetical protein NT170_01760 [Candidatus Moranbacteria bacterium]|nr:hypothetical protein [Candidatus Moranbacteria bacterium]
MDFPKDWGTWYVGYLMPYAISFIATLFGIAGLRALYQHLLTGRPMPGWTPEKEKEVATFTKKSFLVAALFLALGVWLLPPGDLFGIALGAVIGLNVGKRIMNIPLTVKGIWYPEPLNLGGVIGATVGGIIGYAAEIAIRFWFYS